MGFAAFMMAAQAGTSLLGSVGEQGAAREQSLAEQKELVRQQEEENLRAAEEKSDRVREADKEFAAAVATMEAVGGAGSMNEGRFTREVAGTAALDLSRLEGNRKRANQARSASIVASQNRAASTIQKSRGAFLGQALGFGGELLTTLKGEELRDTRIEESRIDSTLGSS